jgi:hypothetical protein
MIPKATLSSGSVVERRNCPRGWLARNLFKRNWRPDQRRLRPRRWRPRRHSHPDSRTHRCRSSSCSLTRVPRRIDLAARDSLQRVASITRVRRNRISYSHAGWTFLGIDTAEAADPRRSCGAGTDLDLSHGKQKNRHVETKKHALLRLNLETGDRVL